MIEAAIMGDIYQLNVTIERALRHTQSGNPGERARRVAEHLKAAKADVEKARKEIRG